MSKLDDIFEQEFAVYYSDLDGQYHNGRQSDAIVPVDNAKKQLKALMLELTHFDKELSSPEEALTLVQKRIEDL